jgi:hypothetical protein
MPDETNWVSLEDLAEELGFEAYRELKLMEKEEVKDE